MSLRELARADAKSIIATDGDQVTLTAPAALAIGPFADVPCNFVRRGMTRDVEGAGFAVVGDSASITLALGELASRGITDPEILKQKGWTATIDGATYRLDEAPSDYTVGVVTVMLKRSA